MRTKKNIIDIALADADANIVTINSDAVARFSLASGGLPNFSYATDPGWSLVEKSAFWIYCSAQAFQFWTRNDDGSINRFKHNNLTGSFAMFQRIRESWEAGGISPLSIPAVFATAPVSEERIKIARELSAISKLHEISLSIIESAMRGALGITEASMLQSAFPLAFDDPYLKKAQLAIFAIGRLVEEENQITIDYDLTAFADYQVPRVLRAHDVIIYSPELLALVGSGTLIEESGTYERAIRSATILAVEELANATGVPAVFIDNALWSNQDVAKNMRFHLTQTTQY